MRTIAEINQKIRNQSAVVWTVEQVKAAAANTPISDLAKKIDVVTTGGNVEFRCPVLLQ